MTAKKKTREKTTTLTPVSIRRGNNLDFTKWQKPLTFSRNTQSNRQPARTRREIDEPCARQTSPFPLFPPSSLVVYNHSNSKEPPNQQSRRFRTLSKSEYIHWLPKRRKSLEEGGKSQQLAVEGVRYEICADIASPAWILAPLFFAVSDCAIRGSYIQELKRILMRRVYRDAAAAAGGGEGTRLVQMRDEAQHLHTVKKNTHQ